MILLTDLIRNLSDDCNRVSTREALEHAENQGHVLCCYANPMDDGREGLTVDEAEAIAREDIGLIYVSATTID